MEICQLFEFFEILGKHIRLDILNFYTKFVFSHLKNPVIPYFMEIDLLKRSEKFLAHFVIFV